MQKKTTVTIHFSTLHTNVVCDSKVISDTKLVDKVKAKVREVTMAVDTS